MDISVFAFKLLILTIPGIIAYFTYRYLVTINDEEFSILLLKSLIYAMISYMIYWIGLNGYNKIFSKQIELSLTKAIIDDKSNIIKFREIIIVSIIGAFVGIIFSLNTNKKLLNKLARLCRITNKFGDSDVWSYCMNSDDVEWVTIRDTNANIGYMGYVHLYSEASNDLEILLKNVIVFDNKTGERLYKVDSVYLKGDILKSGIEIGNIQKEGDQNEQQNTTSN